jgi:glycosyltransferase involved in cell wall biosynthesis
LAANLDVLDFHPEACFSAVAPRIMLGLVIDREKFDLFHGTANFLPRTRGPTKRVVSVLDTIPATLPDQVTRSTRHGYLKQKELRPEDQLVSISNAALDETLALFDHPREASRVIYLGIDHHLFQPARPGDTPPSGDPYLLTVGMFEPRKNLSRALEAFERLSKNHPNLRWKLVGGQGFGYDSFVQAVVRSPARSRIDLEGPRGDTELADLYRGAAALLFPTLKEGFGFPVAEALACGTPVAASKIPAVEEAGGDAFVHLDPTNVDSIVEAAEKAAFHEGGRSARRDRGIAYTRRFQWAKTIEEHLAVYARALDRPADELMVTPPWARGAPPAQEAVNG